MNASFLRSVSRYGPRRHQSGTDGDRRRVVDRLRRYRRQHGWTCPQLVRTKESNTFSRDMLGSVLDRQPTVILQVFFPDKKEKENDREVKNE